VTNSIAHTRDRRAVSRPLAHAPGGGQVFGCACRWSSRSSARCSIPVGLVEPEASTQAARLKAMFDDTSLDRGERQAAGDHPVARVPPVASRLRCYLDGKGNTMFERIVARSTAIRTVHSGGAAARSSRCIAALTCWWRTS